MSRTSDAPPSRSNPLVLLCALGAVLADFVSKTWAQGLHRPLEAGHFVVAQVGNDALVFSVGGGVLPTEGLVLARLALFALFAFTAARSVTLRTSERLGFALIAAGGLGNLIDLPLRGGAVVDFIGINPVALVSSHPGFHLFFNLADVFIVGGVVLAFPVARALGLRAQRRFRAWEALALGRGSSV